MRRRMAVIPQDSFVFSGSLRFNVDPFQEFGDVQIHQILSTIRFFETLEKSSNEESKGLNIRKARLRQN